MSETAATRKANKAQKKQRTILIVLASFAALFWGRALFGGDEKADPYKTAAGQAAAPAGAQLGAQAGSAGRASVGPVTRRGQITVYEQASERMRLWPDALAREVIEGPIQELTPFNSNGPAPEPISNEPEREVEWNSGPVAFDGLGLRLSSTMLLGNDNWAVINGRTVREGEVLNLQVSGVGVRYVVEAIKAREVQLRDGEDVHVLKITVGSTPDQRQPREQR